MNPESGPPRVGSGERGIHAPHLFQLHHESVDVPPMNYVYELSGIVIHSGQAHAGHYYSLIRDRGRMESWVHWASPLSPLFQPLERITNIKKYGNFHYFNAIYFYLSKTAGVTLHVEEPQSIHFNHLASPITLPLLTFESGLLLMQDSME